MTRTLISVCLKPASFSIDENSEKSQLEIFSFSQNTLFTLNVLEKIYSTSENKGVCVCACAKRSYVTQGGNAPHKSHSLPSKCQAWETFLCWS